MMSNSGAVISLFDGKQLWRLEAWTIRLHAFSTIA